MDFTLEKIIQKPTWKQVLLDLIITEQINPWDVDIAKMADGFIKKIKEINDMELYLSANMILASAILLKYKSSVLDNIKEQEYNEEPIEEYEDETQEREQKPEIKKLEFLTRLPPKRPITLQEIINEIDAIVKFEEKRKKTKKEVYVRKLNIRLDSENIEQQMKDIYLTILKKIEEQDEKLVLFSKLLGNNKNRKKIISTLTTLLHLTKDKKIDIVQKELYGEIKIYPIKEINE